MSRDYLSADRDAEIEAYEAEIAAQFDREHAAPGDTAPATSYPPTPAEWGDAGLRSHQRMAKRFATYAEGYALYVNGTGWHYWDGTRWAPDMHNAQAHGQVPCSGVTVGSFAEGSQALSSRAWSGSVLTSPPVVSTDVSRQRAKTSSPR